MTGLVPSSWGSPLREFNLCHAPEDGKFCSGSAGGGFVKRSDEFGSYFTVGQAVDPNGNWKRFDRLADTAEVVFYHATSRGAAEAILQSGWAATKGYTNSSPDHVYLGGRGPGTGTYLGRHGHKGVLLAFVVKKGDVEPDAGTDWKSHARLYRQDVIRFHGRSVLVRPTATATYAAINQVRVRADKARPVGIVEPEGKLRLL